MNITILGAGAMGSLFSGYLSRSNNVSVIDVNGNTVKAINEEGVRIREKDGSVGTYHPASCTDSSSLRCSGPDHSVCEVDVHHIRA